jgi:hypothetical protein
MAVGTPAARHGRLLEVNLPDRKPFVNPESAHPGEASTCHGGGRYRQGVDLQGVIRRPLTAALAGEPPASTTSRRSAASMAIPPAPHHVEALGLCRRRARPGGAFPVRSRPRIAQAMARARGRAAGLHPRRGCRPAPQRRGLQRAMVAADIAKASRPSDRYSIGLHPLSPSRILQKPNPWP